MKSNFASTKKFLCHLWNLEEFAKEFYCISYLTEEYKSRFWLLGYWSVSAGGSLGICHQIPDAHLELTLLSIKFFKKKHKPKGLKSYFLYFCFFFIRPPSLCNMFSFPPIHITKFLAYEDSHSSCAFISPLFWWIFFNKVGI